MEWTVCKQVPLTWINVWPCSKLAINPYAILFIAKLFRQMTRHKGMNCPFWGMDTIVFHYQAALGHVKQGFSYLRARLDIQTQHGMLNSDIEATMIFWYELLVLLHLWLHCAKRGIMKALPPTKDLWPVQHIWPLSYILSMIKSPTLRQTQQVSTKFTSHT